MRVIVPVAGFGTRLRPHTFSTPKPLLNVADKPIIGHVLDSLEGLKPEEVVLIMGQMGDRIVDYVKKNYPYQFRFVTQRQQLGLGHAIYLGLKDSTPVPTLIILGDTIIETDLTEFTSGGVSIIGTLEVDNPERFGVVKIVEGNIVELVEKSETPPSNLAIIGIYYIKETQKLYDALDKIIKEDIRTRGEYQLTDGLAMLLKKGINLKPKKVDKWLDCGTIATLLETNRYLLSKKNYFKQREKTVIKPPVYIADSAQIEGSLIGPEVSIGEQVEIKNSIIKGSIIFQGAQIIDSIIAKSIIGEHAQVKGEFSNLNIGNTSSVEIT